MGLGIEEIPEEMLAQIFVVGQTLIDTEHILDAEETSNDTTLPFELLVSHVTRHWRRVAVTTATLWRCIDTERNANLVRIYMARSSKGPLYLRVAGNTQVALLRTILFDKDRWQRLTLVGPEPVVLSSLERLNVPNLCALSIHADNVDDLPAFREANSRILTQGSPNLRFLRLRGFAVHFIRPCLTTVTTLHIDQTMQIPITSRFFCDMVSSFPSLENLSLYGDINRSHPWPAVCRMSALKRLRICCVAGHSYGRLLTAIEAPNLESLVLKDVQEHDLDELWMSDVDSRFVCLRSLTVIGFDFSLRNSSAVCAAFPHMTHFTSIWSSSERPRLLTALQSHPEFWPELNVLAFTYEEQEEEEEFNFLQDILSLRHIAGRPLLELRLATSDDITSMTARASHSGLRVERMNVLDGWPFSDTLDSGDTLFQ
ncbi:hypothetical protein FISHEDRAFT_52300 [Fistulina hepatica ATCC 64428]|nr:hypothetical protein FISHEDRAFT_52300 [Fistulina hepatica ATCC 64428]